MNLSGGAVSTWQLSQQRSNLWAMSSREERAEELCLMEGDGTPIALMVWLCAWSRMFSVHPCSCVDVSTRATPPPIEENSAATSNERRRSRRAASSGEPMAGVLCLSTPRPAGGQELRSRHSSSTGHMHGTIRLREHDTTGTCSDLLRCMLKHCAPPWTAHLGVLVSLY
eukprot:TRINITY_DN18607_c0_g1_i1.p2 TRINITY_DN18607_c0_g1~~TRINITY_DN18607_c0_g1_i1.p2  ORF type:complete len:169 (-),score=15.48 TRINITY_DN18607_c0_g1_i1:330-836(-)